MAWLRRTDLLAPVANARGNDWPNTTRVLPWAIAGFLAIIFLLPFDAMTLPVNLPVEANPDRIFLGFLIVLWIFAALTTRSMTREFPVTGFAFMLFIFVSVAFASVLLNVHTLVIHDQFNIGVKKLGLLVAFSMFFVISVTTIRPTEVRAFGRFMVLLGCLTAIGTIYEFHTNHNVFRDWSAQLFHWFTIAPPPTVDASDPYLRRLINGPTAHGLAVATMLAIALPWAVVELYKAKDKRHRLLWFLATGLLLTGGFSTLRKTSAILPLVVLLVLFLYHRRQMIRIFPIGLCLIAFVQVVSPGALSKVKAQIRPDRINNNSTQGRTADYSAVRPDIVHRITVGRGFGTYEPDVYRYLDNEYLKRVIETGFLGAMAYLLMVLASPLLAHRVVRAGDPTRAGPALAASIGALVYVVGGLLYDIFFFPQAPYLFFFCAALIVILATAEKDAERNRRRVSAMLQSAEGQKLPLGSPAQPVATRA